MPDTEVALLLIDEAGWLLDLLEREAACRGYHLTSTRTLEDALAATRTMVFHAALVDVDPGTESGLEALRHLKEHAPDAEIIVISATASLTSAIRSYELAAFAFIHKPFELGHLFATIERALERRRLMLIDRRLFWELQTVNEVADGISRSLELDVILTGTLQRVVRAFDALSGAVRLCDETTGLYETRASVGPAAVQQGWGTGDRAVPRPSDRVVATRTAVVVEDLHAELPAWVRATVPIRSAVSVPMLAGTEILGTLSVGAAEPLRFGFADERLLSIIAGQVAVAVQNARLHESIRRGKREWEATFDAISEPMAVFDASGLLLRGNTALAAILDRAVTDLRHVTCTDIGLCGGGCPLCAVGRALRADAVTREEITRGDHIFSVTTFPVGGDSSGPAVVQVAKNVTEEIRSARRLRQMSEELAATNAQLVGAMEQLKSTQAQLLQAEKLSAIGQLVAGVAHELNNPLTSVMGYAQLLEEELRDDQRAGTPRPADEFAQDLRRIAEESERAARIVRNLLAFARRQTAARSAQDIGELAGRVVALRNYDLRLNGIELETRFDPGLPPVVVDGSQLQQALLNLVLNAEQAMRGGPVRRLSVAAGFDAEAAAVELSVSDTGHGIDPANLSKIFDPFFTTREVGEGTGLGLSICYGIVRDHGGQIAVESRPQAGTTFSVRLPARLDDAPLLDVLVAVADQGQRDYLAAALGAWGCRVTVAARADDALERFGRGELQATFVDRGLLAADVAAWRAARARAASVPLVLTWVPADDDEIDRFAREHATACLAPPFQLRALWRVLRAVGKEQEYA